MTLLGGVPRTVLQLPAHTANSTIPIRSLIVDLLEIAVNMLPSEVIRRSLLLLRWLVLATAVLVNHNSLSIHTCVLSCCLAVWHNKPWVEVRGDVDQLNLSCCSCIFNSHIVLALLLDRLSTTFLLQGYCTACAVIEVIFSLCFLEAGQVLAVTCEQQSIVFV